MRKVQLTVLLALVLTLCACRTRVIAQEEAPVQTAQQPSALSAAAPVRVSAAAEPPQAPPPEEAPPEQTPEPDAPAEQESASERRAFAQDADGELTSDAETPLHALTEEPADASLGDGAPGEGGAEAEGAALTATETVPADEAEQLGTEESGEVAESVLTYYQTLLDSRLGSLFECKRLYVYWETEEPYRTVYKTSDAHQVILDAGAYDVSAKLLEENLTVDDGWVARKNPDAVVKLVGGGALEEAAARALCDELAARPDWAGLAAIREGRTLVLSQRLLETQAGRTAAAVYLARLLYPAQLEDVDADEALRALTQEAEGSPCVGQYAYTTSRGAEK